MLNRVVNYTPISVAPDVKSIPRRFNKWYLLHRSTPASGPFEDQNPANTKEFHGVSPPRHGLL